MSVIIFGVGHCLTTSTLDSLTAKPSFETIYPRNMTLSVIKEHFVADAETYPHVKLSKHPADAEDATLA